MLTTLGKLYSLGASINWEKFHRFSSTCHKVDIPGYSFEDKRHWLEMKQDGRTPFHPLVGGFLPNPSDTRIFRQEISAARLTFLTEHALGDKVIFPGKYKIVAERWSKIIL